MLKGTCLFLEFLFFANGSVCHLVSINSFRYTIVVDEIRFLLRTTRIFVLWRRITSWSYGYVLSKSFGRDSLSSDVGAFLATV